MATAVMEAVWVEDEAISEAEFLGVQEWLTGRTRSHETAPAEAVKFHRQSLQAVDSSPTERARLIAAVNGLATANAADPRRWGKFPDIHRDVLNFIHGTISRFTWPGKNTVPMTPPPTTNSGWGPIMQFLPWHRFFIAWFEQELRRVDPAVSIPYWDWTTQRQLPAWVLALRPTIATPTRAGIAVDRTAAAKGGPSRSSTGPRDFDNLPSAAEILTVQQIIDYSTFTCELEMQHNRPHVWVGDGFALGNLDESPADFIFFLHHANIDRIWASWQRDRELAAIGLSMAPFLGGVSAATMRAAAAHPQPSMALAMSSTFSTPPTIGGRAIAKVSDVLSTADLEYDYV
jgi:hypothetical protein